MFCYSEYWLGGPSQHVSKDSHWRRWEAFLWASVHLLSKVSRSKQEFMLLPNRYLNLRHLTSGCTFPGYLPALVVSLILLGVQSLSTAKCLELISYSFIATCITKHLDSDASHPLQIVCTSRQFCILLWNTWYRPANVFFAFFSISLLEAINCFKDDPDGFIKLLAKGIIGQSAYLMNLIILATGQETMLQLLQWRSLIKQAVIRPLINLNARSRRYREWLNEAPQFEQSFIFGE